MSNIYSRTLYSWKVIGMGDYKYCLNFTDLSSVILVWVVFILSKDILPTLPACIVKVVCTSDNTFSYEFRISMQPAIELNIKLNDI